MILWDSKVGKLNKNLKMIPGALLAVIVGVMVNYIFANSFPQLFLEASHRVDLPTSILKSGITDLLVFPNFNAYNNPVVYSVAVTLAIVASIESLLSIEASDRLDPYHRITPLNRELFAQGTGNIVSGLLGGLPVTAVIVRTSANLLAGAVSSYSTIIHGVLLAISIVLFPLILNSIPLSALSAILLIVGFKLYCWWDGNPI